MQALMLAAGFGRRLGRYTNNQTKCMVEVAGKTLLEHTVEALVFAGIKKMVMVIGYEGDKLVDFIKEKKFPIEFEFIRSEDYATTNNIYSLYLAKEKLMEDDTILLESDLIYDVDLIQKVLSQESENVVVVDKYRQWMDGTVATLDHAGNIKEFVEKKDFDYKNVDSYYKTVNIYKLSKSFSEKQYIPFLKAYIEAYGKNQYYELVLKAIAHLSAASLKAMILEDTKWYEIDDGQDLEIANTLFATDEELLGRYELHYGGYWRFDNLKDFCYLVNPYFPPSKMIDHMKYSFDTLMREYPSGMTTQKLIAGKMFSMNEELLLVGNGAAELIAILGQELSGKMAISLPAFHEYVRCFPGCTFHEKHSKELGFRLDKEFFKCACGDCDIITIINPDNPSGAFLEKSDLFEILEVAKETNTTCIVDESFIDFAEGELRYTLLEDGILEQYPQLIVIKSISKSYGIPGARLGVLATSNQELLQVLRYKLPVWNINSFGEYFFQIYNIYGSEYTKACDKIAECRTRFQKQLEEISCLTVYPSQANYVMCGVQAPYTSRELATVLLKKKQLLIKDLSTKTGFFQESYVRFAVKSKEDNDELYHCLKELDKGSVTE